jgi:hypothetical protein
VLKTILLKILPEELVNPDDIYADDIFVDEEKIPRIKMILAKNGFNVKEPEDAKHSRILGLKNVNGKWRRRHITVPTLEKLTRRGVHEWTGKLTSHVLVATWLRPAAYFLKRLCVGHSPDEWDLPLNDNQAKVCEKLQQDLAQRRDPVGGKWAFDPTEEWTLFTDSSSIAYGAILQIDDVVVEDSTKLRKKGDIKHINLSELLAVECG